MRKAILINKVTGVEVKVHATTDHPASSYGKAVWVDNDNISYCEVDAKFGSQFYDVIDDFS